MSNVKVKSTFREDMDKVITEDIYPMVQPLIDKKIFLSGEFIPPVEKVQEVFKKHFDLDTEHVGIIVNIRYGQRPACDFTYKGIKLHPDGLFILPRPHRKPKIEEILLECIKQDTYRPDIEHLQIVPKDRIQYKVTYFLDGCEELHGVYDTEEEATTHRIKLELDFENDGGFRGAYITPIEKIDDEVETKKCLIN